VGESFFVLPETEEQEEEKQEEEKPKSLISAVPMITR
jgi:hypothetical protein